MPGTEALFPRVMLEDVGSDAALVPAAGMNGTLFLRPDQSFGSAVAAAQRVLPGMHPDAVRRMVRDVMPDVTPDLATVEMGIAARIPSALPVALRRGARRRTLVVAVAAAFAAGGALATGVDLLVDHRVDQQVEDHQAVTGAGAAQYMPLDSDTSQGFADRLGWACEPTGPFATLCTDADDEHVFVTLSVSNAAVTYKFERLSSTVSIRWMESPGAAERWVRETTTDGVIRPNVRVVGQVATWGNDVAWQDALLAALPAPDEMQQHNETTLDVMSPGEAPLIPPRGPSYPPSIDH